MAPTPFRTARLTAATAAVALLAACGGSDAADEATTAGSGFGPTVADSAAAPGGVDSMAPQADVSADTVRDSMPRP